MRKSFLVIFLLFSCIIYGKGYIEELSIPRPIRSSKEKTVFLSGFPTDFETTIENSLETEYGWKVATNDNKRTGAFSIECPSISYTDFRGYDGVVKFTDLRTGKRIAYYEFSSESFNDIVENILEVMDYISEAK